MYPADTHPPPQWGPAGSRLPGAQGIAPGFHDGLSGRHPLSPRLRTERFCTATNLQRTRVSFLLLFLYVASVGLVKGRTLSRHLDGLSVPGRAAKADCAERSGSGLKRHYHTLSQNSLTEHLQQQQQKANLTKTHIRGTVANSSVTTTGQMDCIHALVKSRSFESALNDPSNYRKEHNCCKK